MTIKWLLLYVFLISSRRYVIFRHGPLLRAHMGVVRVYNGLVHHLRGYTGPQLNAVEF
jgi:hypothetical protein